MLKLTPKERVLFVHRLAPVLLVLFGVFSLLSLNFIHSPLVANAAAANTVNFQARLQTNSGAIVPDGNYNVEFKLYSGSSCNPNTGSGCTTEWTEDRLNSASNGLQTINGYLSANLGSVNPFPGTIKWDQQLWLSMNIGGTTTGAVSWDGAMLPYLSLTSVPAAFSANQLANTNVSGRSTLTFQGSSNGDQSFVIQDQGAAGTYNLLAQSNSTGIVPLGSASSLTGKIAFANSASGYTVTLQSAAETVGNATITIPDTAGVADTVCLQTKANCGSSISVGNLDGGTANAKGATLSAGVLYLQSASSSFAGLVNTTAQTFAGDKTFSGNTTLNNTTMTANSTITFTGGATSSRPSSPTKGMLYFDTTTNTLLTYNGSKWMSDKSSATKIVAMGTASGCTGSSPVASSNPDGADYVVTSCTSAQTTINSAISSLPSGGGTVYLEEGTYILDGSINMANNVTLLGAGPMTILKFKDSIVSSTTMINDNFASTNVTVANLKLDGNKANNGTISHTGIDASNAGSATTAGFTVRNLDIENFHGYALEAVSGGRLQLINNLVANNDGAPGYSVFLNGNKNAVVTGNTIRNNGSIGLQASFADGLTATGNIFQSNTGTGLYVDGNNLTITGNTSDSNGNYGFDIEAAGATVSGNTASNNTTAGIRLNSASQVTVSGNNITTNGSYGIYLAISANNNLISSNKLYNNAGSSSNSSLYIWNSNSNNRIENNDITDTAGTGYAIRIDNNSNNNNYLSGNTYSGTGATSISDQMNNTIYSGQVDGSGNSINKSQGGGLTIGASSATATLTIQGGTVSSQLPIPSTPTITKTGGTAASATYGYKVTALDGSGETAASPEGQVTSGYATLTGTAYNTIAWNPVGGATQYKIYRTTVTSGSPTSLGLIGTVSGNTLSFNDTGIVATTAAPASNTTGGATFAGLITGNAGLSISGNASVAGGFQANTINAITGFQFNGTAGATTTCSGGQFLSNQVVQGGIVTSGTCAAASNGVTTVGALDGGTANANGATISGNTIYLQSASASFAGLVNTTTQTFAGNKTFSGNVTVNGAFNLANQVSNSCITGLGANCSLTLSDNGPGTSDTIVFHNTFSLNEIDFNTPDAYINGRTSITSAGDGLNSGALLANNGYANATKPVAILKEGATPGAGADALQIQSSTSAVLAKFDNAGNLQAPTVNAISGYKFNGTAGATTTCSGGQFLSNQVVQGGITTGGTCATGGPTTVGAVDGGTANANGATISGANIYLQSASASFAGLVNTTTQTFAGNKTFSGNVIIGDTTNGGVFINDGATLNTSKSLGNFTVNSAIGTAATTVDKFTSFLIPQTTSGITLTLPSPTDTTAGRLIYISNTSTNSTAFTIGATNIGAGMNATFIWNGTAWVNASAVGGASGNYVSLQASTPGTADHGNLNIDGAGVFGSTISANALNAGSSSQFHIDASGNFTTTGTGTINVASSTAFTVKNGASTVFNVNTSTGQVTVNNPSASSYALDVNGDINSNTNVRVGGVSVCVQTGCTPSSGSNNYIQNATTTQTSANLNIRSASTSAVTAVLQGANGQTADMFQIASWNGTSNNTLVSVSSNGLLSATNGINLGISGSTAGSMVLNSTGAGNVTLKTQATASSYTIALPGAIGSAGQCLAVGSVAGSVANMSFTTCGGGTHSKSVTLTPEFAGAVLNASNDASCSSANTGTMTSDNTGSPSFNSFYKWAGNNGATNQCFDVVVRIPLPSDYSSSPALSVLGYSSDGTAALNVDVHDTSNAQDGTAYQSTSLGTATWNTASISLGGTYVHDGVMTVRIRMTAKSTNYVELGNLVFSYNSAY